MKRKNYRKRRKTSRKRQPSGWTAGGCLLLALLTLISVLLYKHYTQMVLIENDGIQWDDASRWTVLTVDGYSDAIIACDMDGELYISADYINTEYADEALFLDKVHGEIYYTTAVKKMVFTPDSAVVRVQGEEHVYERIFNTYEDTLLVKLKWASQQFGIDYALNEENQVVTLYQDSRDTAIIDGRGATVYLKKSPFDGSMLDAIAGNTEGYAYYRKLEDGERVVCVGSEGNYTKVLTSDGCIGYVETAALAKQEIQYTVNPDPVIVELPQERQISGAVVLAWHQDYSGNFTDSIKALFSETQGIVNVISPTWFKFSESGELISCANSAYVEWAHGEDYQVWALVDNDFADEKTMTVLRDEAKREVLIQDLLEACQLLNLDGINVDFEALSEETAPYFVEFMRELSAVLRPAGYCVSVDVSVPEGWSEYYRRDLLAKCCDYIIVMGYDEHYRGGGTAGSVSSMPWVEKAVSAMLSLAPADKIILGVPFYTQLWSTTGGVVESQVLSMEAAASLIADNQATVSYNEASGQDYAMYEKDGTLCEIWIENTASMEKRLAMAAENQLAGVACWKVGMENAEIWNEFEEYIVLLKGV